MSHQCHDCALETREVHEGAEPVHHALHAQLRDPRRPALARRAGRCVAVCQSADESVGECCARVQALVGVLPQELEQQVSRVGVRRCPVQGSQPHGAALDGVDQHAGDSRGPVGEGMLIGKDDVEHYANGPHVALRAVVGVAQDLRSDKCHRAHGLFHPAAARIPRPPHGGEAKVDELRNGAVAVVGGCEEAVLELEVAMCNTLAMQVGNRAHDVPEEEPNLVHGVVLDVQLAKVTAHAELGDQTYKVLVFKIFVKLHYVRVVQLDQECHFQKHAV
mmetsp:Transcript_15578/g.46686  ORF Transcript_15578/g.46686 Transcript_15578/m.46686 type:complete len:276 (-) Transcript_15578:208-1035(-)